MDTTTNNQELERVEDMLAQHAKAQPHGSEERRLWFIASAAANHARSGGTSAKRHINIALMMAKEQRVLP